MYFKKIVLILSFFIIISPKIYAQLKPVHILGEVSFTPEKVILYEVIKGNYHKLANAIPDPNGKFEITFNPEYEGFYMLGTSEEMYISDKSVFYFKGGEQLNVTLNESTYTLNGTKNSEENIILTQWRTLIDPIFQKSFNVVEARSTYVDFFPLQDSIVIQYKTFLDGKTTNNKNFNAIIKSFIDYDLAFIAASFITSLRTIHPKVDDLSEFYSTLKTPEFSKNTVPVYTYPYGQRLLTSLVTVNMMQDRQQYKSGIEGFQIPISYVANDTLKGDFVVQMLSYVNDYESYQTYLQHFGKYILTNDQIEKSENLLKPLLTLQIGTQAFPFDYPDQHDNQVTLESLLGKVVLVDVWATWCGPCRAEFPFLKQLEKDLVGYPIQIVSITIDADRDKEVWKKMIVDESLSGLQLFAGQNNAFSKYYKINSIPRFLIFDKQGKIVNINSPRPSDPELKEILLKEASKL